METELRPLMTLQEVCVWLKYTEQTVKKLAQKGKIPGRKIGKSWRFDREELAKWVQEQRPSRNA
jgi:excisionase family DNA binding protein